MHKDELEHIYDELKTLYLDIRAEVLITEILENSALDISDFTISPKSTFKRTYRRDVIGYQYGASRSDDHTITFNTSRSGIYDTLPEGVFHNPADQELKGLSYHKKREREKKDERDARSFFQPIENEFYVQQVGIEKKERELYDRFASIKNNFLLDFWQLDNGLPHSFLIRLIKLLPHAHAVLGNLEATAQCLEKIIGVKVRLDAGWSDKVRFRESKKAEILGVDFVLTAQETAVLCPTVTVHIGPVNPDEAGQYVEGSPLMQFLELFYGYFLPMEMEVASQVEINRENVTFVLKDTEPSLMGLTTII